MNERPTGIIRTLPSLYGDASIGAKKFQQSIKLLEKEKIPAIYIAMQVVPKIDVVHFYLLISGEIVCRMNIAGYDEGSKQICWDQEYRTPKFWAVCCAPVSYPIEPIKRKGFQGFRYTTDLW